jgi:hypothetical protein
MKLCAKIDQSPLPYLMLVLIAGVTAFITWHALGTALPEPGPRAFASALAFAVVGGANLLYIRRCLNRYRRHQHRYQFATTPVPLQA